MPSWVSSSASTERGPRTIPVSFVVATDKPPVVADSCTSVNGSLRPLSRYLGTSAAATVGAAGTSGAGWPA